MPNVMGREFPYTAEGMAAAQQYSQAMGMRDGGSMGFRPIGYDNGGTVDVVAELRQRFYELRDLVAAGASGAESELIDLINREQEGLRASNDPKMNEIINNYLPPTQPAAVSNLDRMSGFIDGPIMTGIRGRYGAERLSDRDLATVQSTLYDASAQQQTPSGFLGAPNSLVATGMGARAAQAMQDPAFAMAEDERAAGTPPRMNRGGIMSLRGY